MKKKLNKLVEQNQFETAGKLVDDIRKIYPYSNIMLSRTKDTDQIVVDNKYEFLITRHSVLLDEI
jgi:hypothetical protein